MLSKFIDYLVSHLPLVAQVFQETGILFEQDASTSLEQVTRLAQMLAGTLVSGKKIVVIVIIFLTHTRSVMHNFFLTRVSIFFKRNRAYEFRRK